jgi:hypothetical protein
MRRIPLFGVLIVIGLIYWGWDATHHDHGGGHGAPLTTVEIERYGKGEYRDKDGTAHTVSAVSCQPGEDGKGQAPNVHFRCDLTFTNGDHDNVVIHVLPGDELMFKSTE